MEPVVMSGSSLNTFLRCARQWEFAYVYRIKRPPRFRMVLGSSAHLAVEVDLKHKVETNEDLPKEAVIQTFVDSFVVNSQEVEDEDEDVGTYLDSGVASMGLWYDEVAPTVAPVLVEQHGQFTLTTDDGSIPYDWTADLIDQELRVRDWKFVSKRPSGGDTYVLNMVGYAVGYRHQTGGIESGVQLDHIVRTKKPYYYPLGSGPVSDGDIAAFADILAGAYKAIGAGVFPPNGLKSGACSWCGYRDICTAVKK